MNHPLEGKYNESGELIYDIRELPFLTREDLNAAVDVAVNPPVRILLMTPEQGNTLSANETSVIFGTRVRLQEKEGQE